MSLLAVRASPCFLPKNILASSQCVCVVSVCVCSLLCVACKYSIGRDVCHRAICQGMRVLVSMRLVVTAGGVSVSFDIV